MENKYYTPEISEFFVGFEYEIFEDFDFYPEKTWHKFTWEYDNLNPEHMSYPFPIRNDRTRVKYLDKQDIQDLGFESTHSYWFEKNVNDTIYQIYPYWKYGSIQERENLIRIFKGRKNNFPYAEIFRGEIKNKSELKKLLTQIL